MIFSPLEVYLLLFLISLTLLSFSWEIIKRFKIILKGEGTFSFTQINKRLIRVFNEFVLQKKVLGQRFIPGLMHALVFWGFIVFALITIDHFCRGFNYDLLKGFKRSYDIYLGIPWAILVTIGILALAYRRFINRPKHLGEKISYTSGIVALFITVLMLTYIIDAYWLITDHNTSLLTKIVWWIHALLILGFLIIIPRSKHLHLVLSPINIFFKSFNTPDHRAVPIDMEGSEEELENLLSGLGKLSKNPVNFRHYQV